MGWFESLIYGLISGLTKFLPVSSSAHQVVLSKLFGIEHPDPLRGFFIQTALLAALITGFPSLFELIGREYKQASSNRRTSALRTRLADIRLVKNAFFPMLLGFLIFTYIFRDGISLIGLSASLFLNGVILFVPGRMMQGNKSAQSMTVIDSFLIGLSSALAAIPGLSGIGCIISICIARGADRFCALEWAALLCIPLTVLSACIDLIGIFTAFGAGYIHFNLWSYLLSVIGSYIGGYFGILCIKFLSVRSGISGFAYYSWGAALFSFMLYLTVV